MARKIKIKCNGPKQCLNEVDLDQVVTTTPVLRATKTDSPPEPAERIVLPCRHCAKGKVVITREVIEKEKNS